MGKEIVRGRRVCVRRRPSVRDDRQRSETARPFVTAAVRATSLGVAAVSLFGLLGLLYGVRSNLGVLAFGSEVAYRYLESARSLILDGPDSASALLLPITSFPNLLWLLLLSVPQSVGAQHTGILSLTEASLWVWTVLVWGTVLVGYVRLAGRSLGDVWGVACGGILLASGTFLWGLVRADDLGLLALLVLGVLSLLSAPERVRSRALPVLLLLASISGPVGIGLVLGSLGAVCFLPFSARERITAFLSVTLGCAVSLLIVTGFDPIAPAGLWVALGKRFHDLTGALLRGAWSARLDTVWREIGAFGNPHFPYPWGTGLLVVAGVAALVRPAHREEDRTSVNSMSLGVGMACLLPALVFSSAFTSTPTHWILPVVHPLLAIAVVAAGRWFWTFTRPLGGVPAIGLIGGVVLIQLLGYPRWAGEVRQLSVSQAEVVRAFSVVLDVEPSDRVSLADVPIVRWRFANDGRLIAPGPLVARGGPLTPERIESLGGYPFLEPRLSPWSTRNSPLAPTAMTLWRRPRVILSTQPVLTRSLPIPAGMPLNARAVDLIQETRWIWNAEIGMTDTVCRGVAPHLASWWHIAHLRESNRAASRARVLTTETDGGGRGYGSVLSPEFELTGDTLWLRAACSRADPDCSLRLMVWDRSDVLSTKETLVGDVRHIDRLEPGTPLRSELFAYDVPEALKPLESGAAQGWRVVRIVRGDEMSGLLTDILWSVDLWEGRRARWKLSDRSHEASITLDTIRMGDSPVARVWDFERGDYAGWESFGDAFGDGPTDRPFETQQTVAGTEGAFFANSFRDGSDAPRGILQTQPFTLAGDVFSFRLGGGDDFERLGLQLFVDGRLVAAASGGESEDLRLTAWDVSKHRDREAVVRILDLSSQPWGHVLVDDIRLWRRDRLPAEILNVLSTPRVDR